MYRQSLMTTLCGVELIQGENMTTMQGETGRARGVKLVGALRSCEKTIAALRRWMLATDGDIESG